MALLFRCFAFSSRAYGVSIQGVESGKIEATYFGTKAKVLPAAGSVKKLITNVTLKVLTRERVESDLMTSALRVDLWVQSLNASELYILCCFGGVRRCPLLRV